MGNISSSCFSQPNTSESIIPIQESTVEENTDEQIDKLEKMLIKFRAGEVSTSSGEECLASSVKLASQIVDSVSKEAERNINPKIEQKEIVVQEVRSVATRLLNTAAGSNHTLLGLCVVAYAIEKYEKKESNDFHCMELLKELIDLATEVKKFDKSVTGEREKVREAISQIVTGVVICVDYITKGSASRFWAADVMQSQIEKTKQGIQALTASLNLAATTYTADCVGHIAKRSVPLPSKLLDFQPDEDLIGEQAADVKKLLDIEGSEQALAVLIAGHGGLGKSTLAASVIQSLNLSDFKFSMVTIDQKAPDKRSHILKLQSDIIFHLTGKAWDLSTTLEGRQKLQDEMASKSCFLFIDNVVDRSSVMELLPSDLLPHNSLEKRSEKQWDARYDDQQEPEDSLPNNQSEEKSAENSETKMQKTKIRILLTSRENVLESILNIKKVEIYNVQELSDAKAKKFLKKTILKGNKRARDFEEERMLDELANACRKIPLLLSTFGNHLKDKRDKGSYEEAIQALTEGNIDRYSLREEDLLSDQLMFVYDQMKDGEAKEAFLDICTYFHGWHWDEVADVVDSTTLAALYDRKLIMKSETDAVIVQDILRLMGAKKAGDTRLMNYEEFFDISDDVSKLKSVRGMVLVDRTFTVTLQTEHLNAMRHSLRFLVLGDWIRVDGPPCDRAFKKLRYLQVGDLKDFPFKDVSKMEKLNVFRNGSKPGMELAQLPSTLKVLHHQIPYRDCNEFARLPLRNLKSLKEFHVETKRSVKLPQGFKLPASLQELRLISCEELPETFSHLSALKILCLDKCDLKCLPQSFTQSVQLTHLSLKECTNIVSLPGSIFESLCLLTDLLLTGCSRLEALPAEIGKLTALQNLCIEGCKSLRTLPKNFGELKSLKTLALKKCIRLESLPDSFGSLLIEHLTVESLDCLKELPQSIGNLCCLKSLRLVSCLSLEFVPDSFVQLTKFELLVVNDCPLLTTLPVGFQALKILRVLDCCRLVSLPACSEMLLSLEVLHLAGLSFTSLPDELGKLQKLKILRIICCKFQTVPPDFENLTASQLRLSWCPILEGTTMDKVVKLQNCYYVDIRGSTRLIERWNELEGENKNLPMMVRTSQNVDVFKEERDRARRVGLLCGECRQLDSSREELNHHSSISIPNTKTTVAVISLHLDPTQLLQPIVAMAKERAKRNCEEQLRIIYVCRSDHSDACNGNDETEKIRQVLMILPQGISYAIPSTDIRRLYLIGLTYFGNSGVLRDGTGPKLLCSMVDVREVDEGHLIFEDYKLVREDEISKIPMENADEEIENSNGIVEFINCISESETQSSSSQCCRPSEENMVGEFIQKLKESNIHNFSDEKVKVDHLQGKTIAIILIDQNYPECKRLQQIYVDIKLKHSNFEAVWIPLQEKEDFGFGAYSRAIQCMHWLTLADPKIIKMDDIKDKSPRVIVINSGGSIRNSNALSLMMSGGAHGYPFTKDGCAESGDACPFMTKGRLTQLDFKSIMTNGGLTQLDFKSSLEFLFHSTEFSVSEELNNKLLFIYAEPPSQELKMNCDLAKLVQIHGKGNFKIIYVGRFFVKRKVADNLHKAYKDATKSMNLSKLSFGHMIAFWYRCKYLLDEKEQNSASTASKLLKALMIEERWLVVVDGDGIVTVNGRDIVEMASESHDEKDEKVDKAMKEELRESLKEGKCREMVRTIFRDELHHPQLHQHPLTLRWKRGGLYCNRCFLKRVCTPYGKRIYTCDLCYWHLCSDCWKEFVKEDVRTEMADNPRKLKP